MKFFLILFLVLAGCASAPKEDYEKNGPYDPTFFPIPPNPAGQGNKGPPPLTTGTAAAAGVLGVGISSAANPDFYRRPRPSEGREFLEAYARGQARGGATYVASETLVQRGDINSDTRSDLAAVYTIRNLSPEGRQEQRLVVFLADGSGVTSLPFVVVGETKGAQVDALDIKPGSVGVRGNLHGERFETRFRVRGGKLEPLLSLEGH